MVQELKEEVADSQLGSELDSASTSRSRSRSPSSESKADPSSCGILSETIADQVSKSCVIKCKKKAHIIPTLVLQFLQPYVTRDPGERRDNNYMPCV